MLKRVLSWEVTNGKNAFYAGSSSTNGKLLILVSTVTALLVVIINIPVVPVVNRLKSGRNGMCKF